VEPHNKSKDQVNQQSHIVDWRGDKRTLIQWARDPMCVVEYDTFRSRILDGWGVGDAMMTPAHGGRKFLIAFGERKTIKGWLDDPRCVVTRGTLKERCSRGWDLEEAMTTPPDKTLGATMVSAFGEFKSLSQWHKDPRCKVSRATLSNRINQGWIPMCAIVLPPHSTPVLERDRKEVSWESTIEFINTSKEKPTAASREGPM